MGKRAGKYVTRTDEAVKQALLKLLGEKSLSDVTVSELAREAHVSRSTFYEHFGNPGDVYDALIGDAMGEIAPLMSQVACSDGFRHAGKPFCVLVRDAGEMAPAVRDARFLESYLAQNATAGEHDLFALLTEAGYSDVEARAVCRFQMSGCATAARMTSAAEEEWERIRAVIDRFILGGIAACLAAKKAEHAMD